MRSCDQCRYSRSIGYNRYLGCRKHLTTVRDDYFCTDHAYGFRYYAKKLKDILGGLWTKFKRSRQK